MDFEDLLAADDVGVRHDHLAVEAPGPQQRRVEHVRPVGRGDQDDAFIRLEAVHLDEQLIEGLLALVIAAAEAGAAMTADRVDLVDEDDAGRVLLALLEHVAHPARADADEHLDEIRAGDREERHVRLAGDGAGQQGLAGARRPDQQHALRDLAAEPLKLLRILQVLDDLLELLLRLVDAGNILEGDAPDLLGQQPRSALAEAHRAAAAALHLAHEEDPHADQEQHREPGDQHAEQRRHVFVDRRGGDPHALVGQPADQVGIVRRVGRERAAIGEMAADVVALDRDVGHLAAIDVVEKIRKGEGGLRSSAGRGLEQVEERDEKQPDDDPEGEILAEIVHVRRLSMPSGASRIDQSTPAEGRPATIFARFRDKWKPELNNCKARLRQPVNRAKDELRQVGDALASVAQMRNGGDAVLVPCRRQDREEQARQDASLRQRSQPVELRHAGRAQITDRKGLAERRRQAPPRSADPRRSAFRARAGPAAPLRQAPA